jgi:hypothetical protein
MPDSAKESRNAATAGGPPMPIALALRDARHFVALTVEVEG